MESIGLADTLCEVNEIIFLELPEMKNYIT